MNEHWVNLLKKFSSDERLTSVHIALMTAIIYLGLHQKKKKKIFVSRSRLMKYSHIKTHPTYHKYFKELQEFGYFKYTPSYHPGVKSYVMIK
ncbi:hypothetical protein SAMN05421593_4504 [Chryseobacterium culicis]|uniref:Transcriptional regulator n=1 Tax=Chryseobacterium culicis TaxID=680127 RepID=A0A1H6IL36_CHRCI|nr:hypothetical protein SAMN05421593_4504 [Chryseobacterium culicis]